MGVREEQQRVFRRIQSIRTLTGSAPGADNDDSVIEFSISGEAFGMTEECKCNATLNAIGRNDFQLGAVDTFGRRVLEATGDCYDKSCNGRPIVTLEIKAPADGATDSWFAEWVEIAFDDGSACR